METTNKNVGLYKGKLPSESSGHLPWMASLGFRRGLKRSKMGHQMSICKRVGFWVHGQVCQAMEATSCLVHSKPHLLAAISGPILRIPFSSVFGTIRHQLGSQNRTTRGTQPEVWVQAHSQSHSRSQTDCITCLLAYCWLLFLPLVLRMGR